jgi:hypothetical protein
MQDGRWDIQKEHAGWACRMGGGAFRRSMQDRMGGGTFRRNMQGVSGACRVRVGGGWVWVWQSRVMQGEELDEGVGVLC